MQPDPREELRRRLARQPDDRNLHGIAQLVREVAPLADPIRQVELVRAMRGVDLGPLADVVVRPGVTDILVNGPHEVWVDEGNVLTREDVGWSGEPQLRAFASRLASVCGRRLDDAQPFAEFRLPSGVRCHAVIPPLADATHISIRIPRHHMLTLDQLCLDSELLSLLKAIVERRLSFLVTGATGAGKTTLMAAMLALVPGNQRIVIVEDTHELTVNHAHEVSLHSRMPNSDGAGEVTMRMLIRQALRMRPDRLVVGEARGAEISDLLTALNSGHEGGCATVHAHGPQDVIARIEALGSMAGMTPQATRTQFASAFHVVVHMSRDESGQRGVSSLGVVLRDDDDVRVVTACIAQPQLRPGPGWDALRNLLTR